MHLLQTIVGAAFIILGAIGILFGVYAVLYLKSFYARIVITSKVEAMGFTATILGCMILAGASFWTAKLALILVFELLTVAVSSHAIARSAWKSGYHLHLKKEQEQPHD
jgi:multicomponent Na+:H+ antiporter subunit G